MRFRRAQLNRFVALQSLSLTSCGLRSVDGFRLPKLRVCNLDGNAIADLKSVLALVAGSPMLESLSLHGNPCAAKPHARERLAASSTYRLLRTIDGRAVSINEIVAGVDELGDKRERAQLETTRFDLHFSELPAVVAMSQWRPELVTDVDLRRCELVLFHIGPLRNLRRLCLSQNRIAGLVRALWGVCCRARLRRDAPAGSATPDSSTRATCADSSSTTTSSPSASTCASLR